MSSNTKPESIPRDDYEALEAAIRSDQMSHRDAHALIESDRDFRLWLTTRAAARCAQDNGKRSDAT